jgi:hypothetical protein
LNIGSKGAYPILTFTTVQTDLESNAPSEEDAKTIVAGIKETYSQMSNEEVAAYLLRADGLRGKIDPSTIRRWVHDA